jgi:hypothetical protein
MTSPRLRFLTPIALVALSLVSVPAFADRGGRNGGGQRGQAQAGKPAKGQRVAGKDQAQGKAGQRGQKRVGDVRTRASLARTHILLKVARASIKRGGQGRDRFRLAALEQRAAGIALRHDAPKVALHLTRLAREQAREIIAKNRASAPAKAADQPGEFDAADAQGAERFVEQARKQKRSPKAGKSLGRSGGLLIIATRATRKGGKGKDSVRRAAVYQRAARAAGQRGEWKTALHLTGKSRKSAREALGANGVAAPAETADQPGEFDEAVDTGAAEYVEAANAAVPAEVDEQVIASWESEATDDLVPPTADLEIQADVDFDTYEYELDTAATGTATVGATATTP